MATDIITSLLDNVIGREGGYSNNPDDRGGPTRWGITQSVARAYGYGGDMRALPRETAFKIYRAKYVMVPRFNEVVSIDERIAAELIDTGVNMGVKVAAQILQRLLNALNREGKDYPDLLLDGALGDVSLGALKRFKAIRGAEGMIVLLAGMNCLQGDRYVDLCERRPANETFLYGWLKNRVCEPDDFHPLKGAR